MTYSRCHRSSQVERKIYNDTRQEIRFKMESFKESSWIAKEVSTTLFM